MCPSTSWLKARGGTARASRRASTRRPERQAGRRGVAPWYRLGLGGFRRESVRDQAGSRFLHSCCTLCVEEERAQDRAFISDHWPASLLKVFSLGGVSPRKPEAGDANSLVSVSAAGARSLTPGLGLESASRVWAPHCGAADARRLIVVRVIGLWTKRTQRRPTGDRR